MLVLCFGGSSSDDKLLIMNNDRELCVKPEVLNRWTEL